MSEAMNAIEDIQQKRAILLTVRLRFAPQVQPVKEAALDKIAELMLFAGGRNGSTLDEIQEAFVITSGHEINPTELRASLKRLQESGRVLRVRVGRPDGYILSDDAKGEVEGSVRGAEALLRSVVRRLFRNTQPDAYTAPFLKCLSVIFSRLGEESVRLIKGDFSSEQIASLPSIPAAVVETQRDYPWIDRRLLETAVAAFFQERDPNYDAIKWNMAQNLYVAKALGLDPTGYPLSEAVFKGAQFYFDTNVMISALEPRQQHHRTFRVLVDACRHLGIDLAVCSVSIDELQRWTASQRELLAKVVDQIPAGTAPRVRSAFFEVYRELSEVNRNVTIDEVFAALAQPEVDLRELYQVGVEDDPWFAEARMQPQTALLAENLRAKYQAMRGLPKRREPAIHDAIVLRWIQKRRAEGGRNVWLVTADRSLPGPVPPRNADGSLAITVDALLHWVSPFVAQDAGDPGFTQVFADMIKYRVLPQDRIFDLEDFLVFHELHMSCKELPEEDVEECVRYLRKHAPTLDPSNPADRERLSYEVSRFFADPGRKYKLEIERLERKLGDATKELANLRTQRERDVQERDRGIAELQRQVAQSQEESKRSRIRKSAQSRMALTLVAWTVLETIAVVIALRFGEGSTWLQKLMSSWTLLVFASAVALLIGWFVVGRERLGVLGWPFTRIFGERD